MRMLPLAGRRPRDRSSDGDEGSAMILVLMVMVLVMALGSTIAAVTINNLLGARRADEAGKVLNAAEAGVAQAVTFIRQNGVNTLTCAAADDPTSAACTKSYGSGERVGPPTGNVGAASYAVWIEEQEHYSPKNEAQGVYVVHSVGFIGDTAPLECPDGDVPCRGVSAKVVVSSFGSPRGVFAQGMSHTGNGNATLVAQQIFTSACFIHRNQLETKYDATTKLDPFYGIPAAVHSSGVITTGGQNSCDGKQGNANSSIHGDKPCNSTYPWDQDSYGGEIDTVAGPSCAAAVTGFPDWYGDKDGVDDGVYGSKIASAEALMAAFKLKESPLTTDEEERLKRAAEDSHTLYPPNSYAGTLPVAGVYFFDFTNVTDNKKLTVSLSKIPAPTDPCHPPIVVIKNGNADIDGNVAMTLVMLSDSSSYGNVGTTGKTTFTGSIFAKSLDLSGNSTLTQEDCAVDSVPVQLMNVSVTSQTEDQ